MLRTMFNTLPRPLSFAAVRLAVMVPVCTFIAIFLSAVFDDPLGRELVYSFSIGLSCQLLIDSGLHVAAWQLARNRTDSEPLGRDWPGWQWSLPIIVFGVVGGVFLGYVIAGWILGTPVRPPTWGRWRSWFIVLSICLLTSVAITAFYWSRGRLAAADANAERAQRAAAENQLKLLESQLEPHMLFNTLANLRVLIASDPPRAQAMLDRLIAFLRATLGASRVGTHSLQAEFDRVGDYLALMQVRMGPRLQFAFDLPPDLRETPLPPLLLQPLVENSIAHGLEPNIDGGRIDVRASRNGATLVLTVRDNGVGQQPSATTQGTRFGTQQVRDRLATLYGAAATFTLEPATGGGTEARITLPLNANP